MADKKVHSQEAGLIAGLVLGKYFFGAEDLHYGYWTEDLKLDKHNLAEAQKRYSELILKNIPEGVDTVLDVGCGIGTFAEKLIEKGYSVDCVSPSPMLTERAREKLPESCQFYECILSDLETERTYDMILFSESFQYIKLSKGLSKVNSLLKPGGWLLISDFFKTEAEGKSPMGGGHRLTTFRDRIDHYPFNNVTDMDITDQTAPNIDLVGEVVKEVGKPMWDLLLYYIDSNHPWISKFLRWKYKKKIRKIEDRYFEKQRSAEVFKKYKTYRLMMFEKQRK